MELNKPQEEEFAFQKEWEDFKRRREEIIRNFNKEEDGRKRCNLFFEKVVASNIRNLDIYTPMTVACGHDVIFFRDKENGVFYVLEVYDNEVKYVTATTFEEALQVFDEYGSRYEEYEKWPSEDDMLLSFGDCQIFLAYRDAAEKIVGDSKKKYG